MSGEQYVEPWYIEMQKAADAASPAAIAAKAAADKVLTPKPKPQPSGWFNTDTNLSDPNRTGGSRRRSRKSRKSRRK